MRPTLNGIAVSAVSPLRAWHSDQQQALAHTIGALQAFWQSRWIGTQAGGQSPGPLPGQFPLRHMQTARRSTPSTPAITLPLAPIEVRQPCHEGTWCALHWAGNGHARHDGNRRGGGNHGSGIGGSDGGGDGDGDRGGGKGHSEHCWRFEGDAAQAQIHAAIFGAAPGKHKALSAALARTIVDAAWKDWWQLLADRIGSLHLTPSTQAAPATRNVAWSGALEFSLPWWQGRLYLRLDSSAIEHLLAQDTSGGGVHDPAIEDFVSDLESAFFPAPDPALDPVPAPDPDPALSPGSEPVSEPALRHALQPALQRVAPATARSKPGQRAMLAPVVIDVAQALHRQKLSLAVELDHIDMRIRDLINLQPGDVIATTHRLDAPALVTMAGADLLCLGWPGRQGPRHAIELASLRLRSPKP